MQEIDLFPGGSEERDLELGSRDLEHETGNACAGADIEQPMAARVAPRVDRGEHQQRVTDEPAVDILGGVKRGQIEAVVPTQ